MRIFVTGASGWIGSAVTPALLKAGHRVVGLARSEASASALVAAGAEACRGDLADLAVLAAAAKESDGVVHLGYHHDFSQMDEAARIDRDAITALGTALEGTGRPLLIASGTLGLSTGRPATERDEPDAGAHPRIASAHLARSFADRGVRPVVVRFAPTVHGPRDHGFVATLVSIARDKGVAGYLGDGANRWPAVHRLDAADLVRRAVEDPAASPVVHAVAEEGVTARTIAEAIGRRFDLPVRPIAADRAVEHFGWMARFFGADAPASSALTRQALGWEPVRVGLVEDLDTGAYDPA